jgi:hypothetical protein
MKLGLGEILTKAAKMKTKEEKIEYLRKNDSRPLQDIIQYALHPDIKWDLPEGTPPYTPTPYLDQETMLYWKRVSYISLSMDAGITSTERS